MDSISLAFDKIRWSYAERDPKALDELEARIAARGRLGLMLTYSELVDGVAFDLPNLKESPRYVDVADWQDLDRSIVGDFLGHISQRSYDKGGFFASAIVVSANDGTPGGGFYELLKDLGLVASKRDDYAIALWVEHVKKAHAWYRTHGR